MQSSIMILLLAFLTVAAVFGQNELKFDQSADQTAEHQVHIATENGCEVGFCHIGDRCIPRGQVDPDNPCWECDPVVSAVAWSYVKDGQCESAKFPLDMWHLILIIVGSVLLVTLLVTMASYRIKQQLAKRQRVYPNHFVDVPHDKGLLNHMH